MANTKISQLPSYTGTTADLRWFVMNNSGETETFKFTGYTSQVIPGTGVNSFVSINVPRTHAPSEGMLVFGNHSGATASSGNDSGVFAGRNNKTNSADAFVGGGLQNTAGYRCAVIGGFNNTASGNGGGIFVGEGNTCANAAWGGIFAGTSNYLQGSNDNGCVIIGGGLNRFVVNGVSASNMIGGYNNRWHHADSRSVDTRYCYGSMIGGTLNRIEGLTTDSSGSHAYPLLMGGNSNKIFGAESNNTSTTGATILNSLSSTIKHSLYSAVIHGDSSTISGRTQAVMIGTSGRTATTDYATFVENLVVFNYAALDYVDDTAASAGGVVLGQVYHNAGAMRIRIV